jgi:hypothetical protein
MKGGGIVHGSGTARYTSGELGDATYTANGDLVPLESTAAQIGLTAHSLLN